MDRALSILLVLVGLAVTGLPWVLGFASDRALTFTVVAGGVLLTVLGVAFAHGTRRSAASRPPNP